MKFSEFRCLFLFLIFSHCQANKFSVTVFFQCLENIATDYKEICDYKDCTIKLKLCIQYKEKFGDERNCDLLKTTYEFKNVAGMCLNGIYDSRGILKDRKTFNTTSKAFSIYIEAIRNDEHYPFETQKKRITPKLGNMTKTTEALQSNSLNILKIDINIEITCLQNFYGEFCDRYCVNVPTHFRCNETGGRHCLQGYKGEHCNEIKGCPETAQCHCVNKSMNQSYCTQLSIQCSKQISVCTDLKCALNLTNLSLNCSTKSPPINITAKPSGLLMSITMPVTVFGCIIILLLVIIFIQGIYKRKPKPKPAKPTDLISQRSLPPKPRDISYIDDYSPPYSSYLEMRSQHPSQCTYTYSTMSQSQDDSSSTFSPYS